MTGETRPPYDAIATAAEAGLSLDSSDPAGAPLTGGHRLDGSHSTPPPSNHLMPAAPEVASTESQGTALSQDELLLQASQIAEHLRGQLAEINRREQTLNEQLALLDRERRTIRLSVHELQKDLESRQARMKAREEELNAKIATCDKLVGDMEADRKSIATEREQLERERSELRLDAERELAEKREQLRQANEALNAGRQELDQERVRFEAEFANRRTELERDLEQQRATIRDQIQCEFVVERTELDNEKSNWVKERASQSDQLERQRQEFQSELASQRETVEAWRKQEESRLQAETDAHRELRGREHRASIDEVAQLQQNLQQERQLFENRSRFQQDHLESLRTEIENAQREFRVEQQVSRQETTKREILLDLRSRQLEHVRRLARQRDESCQRERRLLESVRQSLQNDRQQMLENLQEARQTWNDERQAQLAEIRRQQDLLTHHAESLEARRERLDRLRAELEETHHATLDMRLAVEETYAELSRSSGEEVVRRRVEEARAAMEHHYRQRNEETARQKSELDSARTEIQEQTRSLQAERDRLAEWISERESKLRQHEDRLQSKSAILEESRVELSGLGEARMKERLEAERMIRELLEQISELSDALATQTTAPQAA